MSERIVELRREVKALTIELERIKRYGHKTCTPGENCNFDGYETDCIKYGPDSGKTVIYSDGNTEFSISTTVEIMPDTLAPDTCTHPDAEGCSKCDPQPDSVAVIEVISGVEGPSLSIDNIRVAGPKPWAGGKVIYSFTVPVSKLPHIDTLTAELERLRELLPDDYELADREAPLGYNALTSLKGKSK